jgi:hypothetical protein
MNNVLYLFHTFASLLFEHILTKVEVAKPARIRLFGASEARVACIEVGTLLANQGRKQWSWNQKIWM